MTIFGRFGRRSGRQSGGGAPSAREHPIVPDATLDAGAGDEDLANDDDDDDEGDDDDEDDEDDEGQGRAGFTLIEVAIAMAILAMLLIAVGTADSVGVTNAARFHGYTRAAQLMRGIVLDIEAEYQEEGFPENSKYGQRCEVPRDFDDRYKCQYDLLALEFEPEEMASMVEQGVQSFLGGGAGGDAVGFPGDDRKSGRDQGRGRDGKKPAGGEGESDGDGGAGGASTLFPELDLSSLAATPGMEGLAGITSAGFDPTQLLLLAPLFGTDGTAIMDICQINIQAMLEKFVAMSAYFPMVVEEAAHQTRKLTVRLTWEYGPRAHRELAITTFIVGIPEEEMRALREAEEGQQALEDLGMLRSPDGGVPSGSGDPAPPEEEEDGGR